MIRIDAALSQAGLQSAMLLTVHDELVFEVPPAEADETARVVREIMEGVWQLRVPLQVNVAGGDNRHDKLAPSMSALIILSHVKEGVELARQYKLPAVTVPRQLQVETPAF